MYLVVLCQSPVPNRGTLTKILRVMKLTSILLILGILQVSGKGLGQTITLNVKDVPLKQVFKEIRKQSGYSFIYGKEQLAGTRRITLNAERLPLETVLGMIFRDQPVTYVITEKYIAVREKSGDPSVKPASGQPLPVEIRGTVRNEKGEAMTGATVTLKGTTTATQTDGDGNFVIDLPSAKGILLVTNIGYEAKEIPVSGQANIGNITLLLSATKLEQVVVTGYSSQRKKDITGSVAVVNMKELKEFPSGTPEQLLQGRAAGVNVITSGSPGGGSILRVRGITSFGGADPLVIIDGTRGDLHDINPNDIESISVLKDAGAAAIYGASGSAGVILVTTKKGKTGKITFNYDGYYGTQRPLSGNVFHLLNPQEQADVMWLALKNSGQAPTSPQYGSGPEPVLPDYLLIGNQAGVNREPTQAELDQYNIDYTKGPIYQIVKANKTGTDWFHEIFKPAAIQSHTLSASGGSDKSAYFLSFGYFNQAGTLINTYLKRYSMRINTTFSNTKKNIRVGENLYLYYKDNLQLGSGNLSESNSIAQSFAEHPIIPVYDIYGGFAGTAAPGVGDRPNPVETQYQAKQSTNNSWSILGNAFAEVDFLKHFTVRTQFGGSFQAAYNSYYGLPTYGSVFAANNNGYGENSSYNRQWVWTNTVSYTNVFALKHTVKLLAGTESISYYSRNMGGTRTGFFINNPNYFNLSNGVFQSQGSGIGQSSQLAYFGQVDYAFDEKYLIGGRFRRDGASLFGLDNRYGNFPSVSAGWRISREKFMETITWINDLKLRGSWGKLGSLSNVPSENQYDLYGGGRGDAYYDIMGTSNSSVQGFRQTRTGNPYTGWEEDIMTNVGLDATVLKNKLDFSVEWYKKRISGLLFTDQAHIYGVGGATLPLINIGDIQNTGIDASATYHGTVNKDLKFDVGVLFTKYKSEIVDIPGSSTFFTTFNTRIGGTDIVRNEEGHPIGSFYGYKVIGLFRDDDDVSKSAVQDGAGPGRFKYADLNKDGKINDDDRTFIGNPNPDFTYGFNLSATYKNFDFSMFLYGSQGNDLVSVIRWWTDFYQSFGGVKSKDLLYNSWTPQNLNAKTPRAETVSNFSTNGVPNSYYVENGSYLRCKSLLIGYTAPAGILSHLGIDKLRIYIQAANLFTITKYSGPDPEIAGGNSAFGIDVGNYPNNQKNFLVGVNISF